MIVNKETCEICVLLQLGGRILENQVQLVEISGKTEDDGVKPTSLRSVDPVLLVDGDQLHVVAPQEMITAVKDDLEMIQTERDIHTIGTLLRISWRV